MGEVSKLMDVFPYHTAGRDETIFSEYEQTAGSKEGKEVGSRSRLPARIW